MNQPLPTELIRVETAILDSLCEFLHRRSPELSPQALSFLCAPWVHYFVHGLWHRLENAGDNIAENSDTADSKFCTEPPGDTLSFMELSRTNEYCAYIDATLAGTTAGFTCRTQVNALKFDRLARTADTIGFQTCLPSQFRHLLSWSSLGKIRFLDDRPEAVAIAQDPSSRSALRQHIHEALHKLPRAWATWIAYLAQALFPRSLLENLSDRIRRLQNLPPCDFLFSANGWPLIDDWKIYALLQQARHGTRLIGSPHAIGHGCLADFWQREFELSHLDTYLTWGWDRSQRSEAIQLIPFYTPYFAGRKQARPQPSRHADGVLISSAARPPHLLEYPYTPRKFEHYLNTQLQIADQVQKLTQATLAIRTRPRDLGWNLKEKVAALGNPKVRLEFQEGKFQDRLQASWIHICDNCSTTIVDSLMANHPTLILITGDYFEISASANPEFEYLAEAGIFHRTPASLMQQLDRVQADIASWWSSHATQNSISRFLMIQGRSGSGLAVWRRALRGHAPVAQ